MAMAVAVESTLVLGDEPGPKSSGPNDEVPEYYAASEDGDGEWEAKPFGERSFGGELRLELWRSRDRKKIRILAMAPLDKAKFEAVFDESDLNRCGFPLRLTFAQNCDTIKLAMSGAESFISVICDYVICEEAQLKAAEAHTLTKAEMALILPYMEEDASKANAMRITVDEQTPMYTALNYLLLPRVELFEIDSVKMELRLAKELIIELRKEIRELKAGKDDEKKDEDDPFLIRCTFDETKQSGMTVSEGGKLVTHSAGGPSWHTCLCHQELSNGKQAFEATIGPDWVWGSGPWHVSIGVVKVGGMTSFGTYVGSNTQSWGYMSTVDKGGTYHSSSSDRPRPFTQGCTVRCECDFNARTIEYYIDGESLGTMFTDLEGPVNPAVTLWQPTAQVTLK